MVASEDGAKQFDPNDTTATSSANWIESFFASASEGTRTINVKYGNTTYQNVVLSRDNFGVKLYLKKAETGTESKKVATSTVVLVEQAKYIGSEPGKFTLHSIGTGDSRKVFLTYNGRPNLPNRFEVKPPSQKDIATSSIVNLSQYEKSIRQKDTENANVSNLVYSPSSNGFYEVGSWLTST